MGRIKRGSRKNEGPEKNLVFKNFVPKRFLVIKIFGFLKIIRLGLVGRVGMGLQRAQIPN